MSMSVTNTGAASILANSTSVARGSAKTNEKAIRQTEDNESTKEASTVTFSDGAKSAGQTVSEDQQIQTPASAGALLAKIRDGMLNQPATSLLAHIDYSHQRVAHLLE